MINRSEYILITSWVIHYSWSSKSKKDIYMYLEFRHPWLCMCFKLYRFSGKWGANTAFNYSSSFGSVLHYSPFGLSQCECEHCYTWSMMGLEPQTFWPWVQYLIHLAKCSNCLGEQHRGKRECTLNITFLFYIKRIRLKIKGIFYTKNTISESHAEYASLWHSIESPRNIVANSLFLIHCCSHHNRMSPKL